MTSLTHARPNDSERIGSAEVLLWPAEDRSDPSYVPRPEIEAWLRDLATPQFPGDRSENVLLVGHPGSGKTSLARNLARELDRPFFRFQGAAGQTASDLLSFVRVEENGNFQTILSAVSTAALAGGVLLLDDIDKIPPDALSALIPALDRNPIQVGQAGALLSLHPDFVFLAAANFAGGDLVPWAASRFFPVAVETPLLDRSLDLVLGSGRVPDASGIRQFVLDRFKGRSPGKIPSLRSVARAARLAAKLRARGGRDVPPAARRDLDDFFDHAC